MAWVEPARQRDTAQEALRACQGRATPIPAWCPRRWPAVTARRTNVFAGRTPAVAMARRSSGTGPDQSHGWPFLRRCGTRCAPGRAPQALHIRQVPGALASFQPWASSAWNAVGQSMLATRADSSGGMVVIMSVIRGPTAPACVPRPSGSQKGRRLPAPHGDTEWPPPTHWRHKPAPLPGPTRDGPRRVPVAGS